MHHDDDAHLLPVDAERIFALIRPDDNLFKLYVIYCVLSNVLFPIVFLPLYFRFKTLRYRFDAEGVAVSYGLLWRRETYLTYARIQDIHVTRNIFERWLGIGTVKIQTASGSANASESIDGVREFNEIRNFLYARMRGHNLKAVQSQNLLSPIDVTLAGIRDELHAIRLLVQENRNV